ncbi:MAG: type VI secretion system protein TssL, long form [Cellvibrionaceae bacterium]
MSDSDKTIIKPRPGQAPAPSDDRTVIKPRPAGNNVDADKTIITPRRKNNGPASFSPATDDKTQLAGRGRRQGINTIQQLSIYDLPGLPELVKEASPLLSIISQLKQLDGSIKIEELRQHISRLVTKFTNSARKNNDQDIVKKASYALCASIDEAILNTPWGENSAWSQKPLLSLFHQETYGGENFYKILDNEVTADVKHYDLIELLYMCLSLGFLGKMRIDKHGQMKAEKIRANTYQLLIKNRNRFKRQLSSNAQPIATEKSKLYSFLPIWLLAATLILASFGFYNHWLLELNKQSDTVVTELASLIPIQREESLPEGQIRKEILFLRQLLQQEIDRGVLSVNDYHNRSAVVLHSNELFSSGSADINAAFHPILDKISKAMESLAGRIIVSGHTDNIAIRTARYPSNWHLSLARASAVGKYMSASADLKARLLPEGRGDSEPVAENTTIEGRAQNRRVAIELFYNEE